MEPVYDGSTILPPNSMIDSLLDAFELFFNHPNQLIGEEDQSEGSNILYNGRSSQISNGLFKHEKQKVLRLLICLIFMSLVSFPIKRNGYSWAALCIMHFIVEVLHTDKGLLLC